MWPRGSGQATDACRVAIWKASSKWSLKMNPPPFDKILFEPLALKFLGSVPEAVRDCLKTAFRNIKQRTLELEAPIAWRVWAGPSFVTVCHHLIFTSEN